MFVKICGITNEDDALFAVAMGADAVGFVFAPSPRQIAAARVYDITRRLPPEILTVGVFRDEHPDRVIETTQRAGLKAAQLHGRETPAMVTSVAERCKWVIKAVAAGSPDARRANQFGTDLVLLERLILAGGLDPDNVANAIERVQPWGVDVSSGVEKSPGRKDPLKVKAFIQRARAAAPVAHQGPDELPYDWADDEY